MSTYPNESEMARRIGENEDAFETQTRKSKTRHSACSRT